MKRKFWMLILAAACLLGLSSCGCKHEWTEADCLTPRTCTQCQETEGEALGHDWQEADCVTPQTCTRCALTQGEALGHSFGNWEMGEAEMTRTCEVCAGAESVEPDYDVYLQQEMQGHWGTHFIFIEGSAYTGYDMKRDILLFYADVTGDQIRYFNMQELYECTWAYESHQTIENGVQYWLLASKDGEPFTSVSFLTADSGETSMMIPLGGENYVWLKRFEEATAVLEGTWVASHEGKGYRLDICTDGTFTGTLPDGDASGTWHLRTVNDLYNSGSIGALFNLSYERDGEQKIDSGSIYFGSTDAGWDSYRNSASISLDNTGLSFRWIGEDQLGTWESAVAEGPGKLVGEWSGTEDRIYDYNTGESTTTIPEGYTVTFLEDGTFTAVLGDEEMTGLWYLDNVTVSYGNISYSYRWKQKESDQETYYISLYNEDKLTVNMPSGSRESRSLSFMRVTEENMAAMAEAAEKPVGTWTSTGIHVYDYETGQSTQKMTTAYSIEVLADGTYTARLEQETMGKWKFSDLYRYEGGQSYEYTCESLTEGFDNARISVWDTGELQFSYTVQGASVGIDFSQMDEAGKAALEAEMEEARLYPVGTWVSHTYTTWDSNTQEGKDAPHSGYTLTFREDGTLSAQLEQSVEGTWELGDIYHGDGYTSFTYGSVSDGDMIWYINYSDGLILSRYQDGISHSIAFEKQ